MWRLLLGGAVRVVAMVIIAAFIAMLRPAFLNPENLTNILRQASLMVLQAAGLTWTIIGGGIDLSIGATLAVAATGGGYLLMQGVSVPLVLTAVLAGGALVGLINGVLTTYVRLPAFIATYGMLWIVQGAANLIMQGQIFFGFPLSFRFVGSGYVAGVSVPVILMALVVLVLAFVQNYTVFGRELYTAGSNEVAATLGGIPVRRIQISAYVVSGLMAALAGLVMIARMDAAEASIGDPTMLPAIGAVVIGGTSMSGGKGGVGGTLVGAVIMTVILNGMNLLGVESLWQPLVVGAVMIVAVGLDLLAQHTANQEAMSRQTETPSKIGTEVA